LFVDDDKLNRSVMTALLEKRDIEVECASSGEEALDLVIVNHYDLILMDLQMPGLSGYEASRAIREKEQNKGVEPTPIFAFSALIGHEERAACLAAGIDDALSKPINVDRLFEIYWQYRREAGVRATTQRPAPTTQNLNDAPLFDASVIHSEFEEAEADDLLDLFLRQADLQVEGIREAVAAKEMRLVETRAHKLKGPSSQYGVMRLSLALRHLEFAGKSRDEHVVTKAARQFEKIYHKSREEIIRARSSSPPSPE